MAKKKTAKKKTAKKKTAKKPDAQTWQLRPVPNDLPTVPSRYSAPIGSRALVARYAAGERFLACAIVRYGDLRDVQLSGACLAGADFNHATLAGAKFARADLRQADLADTDLDYADLRSADLRNADLYNCRFSRAQLEDADLRGAIVGGTVFAGTDLAKVRFKGVRFGGVSHVDFEALQRTAASLGKDSSKQGEVETFLRGCGVPEQIMDVFRSWIGVIQYYTCFISYSHADMAFANRLYEALQARGVRCWKDDKDLNLGDVVQDRINEAIRLHDKVILICSKTSLASKWVEREISMAMRREDKTKQLMLIPLVLDGALDKWESYQADMLTTRLWGDFKNWRRNDAKFLEQLGRVIEALERGTVPGGEAAS
ncbi:toll/interleukin-1 receptor domain-containing protein [Planctomycetota bacterium]|nr:toll/interleukin-1 receptor domain-containing protein [Planctomycetota bacterium]